MWTSLSYDSSKVSAESHYLQDNCFFAIIFCCFSSRHCFRTCVEKSLNVYDSFLDCIIFVMDFCFYCQVKVWKNIKSASSSVISSLQSNLQSLKWTAFSSFKSHAEICWFNSFPQPGLMLSISPCSHGEKHAHNIIICVWSATSLSSNTPACLILGINPTGSHFILLIVTGILHKSLTLFPTVFPVIGIEDFRSVLLSLFIIYSNFVFMGISPSYEKYSDKHIFSCKGNINWPVSELL